MISTIPTHPNQEILVKIYELFDQFDGQLQGSIYDKRKFAFYYLQILIDQKHRFLGKEKL